MLTNKQAVTLLQAAQTASEKAYAPYSEFPVGAALLLPDGEIISGCNVENISFGLTTCAERTAIVKAISEGQHVFIALAVWGEQCPRGFITPCGACRQILTEFMDVSAPIITADPNTGEPQHVTLGSLLPAAFATIHKDSNSPDGETSPR